MCLQVVLWCVSASDTLCAPDCVQVMFEKRVWLTLAIFSVSVFLVWVITVAIREQSCKVGQTLDHKCVRPTHFQSCVLRVRARAAGWW